MIRCRVLPSLPAILAVCSMAIAAVPGAAAGSLPFEVGAAVWTSQAPVVDGVLNDPCWKRAIPLAPFQTLTHRPPEVQSAAYILYDEEQLYIGVRCEEPDPARMAADMTRHDQPVHRDDCVEIFLVPPESGILGQFDQRLRYFHLIVNSLGTRYDEIGMNAPAVFDGDWQAAAAVTDDSWSLELAVPLVELGTEARAGDVWRGNVCRLRTAEREYSTWAPIERTFHDRKNFGQIVFTRDAEATARRIDELELAALVDGLLQPRLNHVRQTAAALRGGARELPGNARTRSVARLDKLSGRTRSLDRALARLSPDNFRQDWPFFAAELSRLEQEATALDDEIAMLAATGGGKEPWVIVITEAMTNRQLLSTRFPHDVSSHGRIRLIACPGEYESATFSVYAARPLRQVRLQISDLRSGGDVLPGSCIDPHTVKCWYQAGRGIGDLGRRLLVPELLLKDDKLVRVDHQEKRNYVRAEGGADRYIDVSGESSEALDELRPQDAGTLQPVDIPARTLKQFWLRVHVPRDAAPGTYRGTVSVTTADGQRAELPVELRVLPFELADPALEYSIYYRGKLTESGVGSISSEGKSETQFAAEMRDLVAHGVTSPTVYQRYDTRLLTRVFEMREAAGMTGPNVFALGISTGAPQTAEALEHLQDGVRRWRTFVEQRGYERLYVYGIDEASGERLAAERAAFAAVHEAGAKVYVACYRDWFELVGDRLDLPVWSGQPEKEQAEKAHSVGARIFNYGNPQCGVEEPETYRRNYGLLLWNKGYDGAMDYAYQHSFGHGWNDFDSNRYRDHNMTYPAVDGVIGTVQWEGFREAVDDVRYVTTLMQAADDAAAAAAGGTQGGGQAPARGPARTDSRAPATAHAARARRWLDSIDPQGDLDEIRAQVIEQILALQELADE